MKRSQRFLVAALLLAASAGLLCKPSQHEAAKSGALPGIEKIRQLSQEARFAEAEELARRLLPVLKSSHGKDSLEVAELLDLLSEAMRRGGKKYDPETQALAERAVAIKERRLGPSHPDVATSLHHLGSVLYVTGKESEARPILERVLAIREETLGEEHPDTAQSLLYLGSLLEELGEDEAALQLLRRSLAVRASLFGEDHPEVAWTLNSIGNLLMTRGDLDEARPYYERALEIRAKTLGPGHLWVSISLSNLALLDQAQGDFARARARMEQVVEIQESTLPPYDPMLSDSLSKLGGLLWSIGDIAAARKLYERAVERQEEVLGPDHPHLLPALCSLAGLTLGQDVQRGSALVRRAVRIVEASGDDTVASPETLSHVSWLLLVTGEFDRAMRMAELAAYGHAGPGEATVAASDAGLRALALAHHARREYPEAKVLLERIVSERREVHGEQSLAVGQALTDLAILLQDMGEAAPAVEAALQSEAIRRRQFLRTGRFLPERQLLNAAWGAWSGALDVALHLAGQDLAGDPDRLRAVWNSQIRSRALVFDELAARRRWLRETGDAEVARLGREYRNAGTRLANLTVRGPAGEPLERYHRRLDTARADAESAELRWAEQSAAFRAQLAGGRAGLTEVIRALPEGSAVVAYSLYGKDDDDLLDSEDLAARLAEPQPQYYVALVLHPRTHVIAAVPLGAAREVDRLVGYWQEEAARGTLRKGLEPGEAEARYRRAGQALRRTIWDPLLPHLGRPERVFVVPDGALHLVSLATLPVAESEYLVERGPRFHYLSAERDLVRPQHRPAAPRLILLTDPAYDDPSLFAAARGLAGEEQEPVRLAQAEPRAFRGQRSDCAGFQEQRFPSLLGSALEGKQVLAVWQRSGRSGAVHLAGPEASEAAFKALSPDGAVLHVATHGFFLSGECSSASRSARGIGGLTKTAGGPPPAITGENPLRLSGLVLAGANWRALAAEGEEDGILTAEEVAALDLSGVDWAVLSACETGVGELARVEGGEVIRGEGLFGLRRSFELAGASTVILSLWSVDDLATREWMKTLYEARFLEGRATDDSVRVAMLDLLGRKRKEGISTHPFTWGAFVSAGDWR